MSESKRNAHSRANAPAPNANGRAPVHTPNANGRAPVHTPNANGRAPVHTPNANGRAPVSVFTASTPVTFKLRREAKEFVPSKITSSASMDDDDFDEDEIDNYDFSAIDDRLDAEYNELQSYYNMMDEVVQEQMEEEDRHLLSSPEYGPINGTSEIGYFFIIDGKQVRVPTAESSPHAPKIGGGAPRNAPNICKFWKKGACQNGSSCRFSHEMSSQVALV
jgi:hypothetical protein